MNTRMLGMMLVGLTAMGAQALHDWAQAHQWPTVSPLLGAYGFEGDLAGYAQRMQTWLAALPADQTAVLMCHPAVSAQADDEIGSARYREFAYLASGEFAQHLQDACVRLVRGSGHAIFEN